MTEKRELDNCSFIKMVLMLFVVLGHSACFWTDDWFSLMTPVYPSAALSFLARYIGGFHIYAFALISGYIYYHNRYEEGKYGQFMPYVMNKARRLILPYMFVTVAWLIPIRCVLNGSDLRQIIKEFIFAAAPEQLWFLWMLFGVFVLIWPVSDYLRKSNRGGVLLSVGLYCAGAVGKRVFPSVFQIWSALQYVQFFLIGFKLRQYGSGALRKVHPLAYITLYAALFALCEVLADAPGLLLKMAHAGTAWGLHVTGAVTAYVVLQWLADRVRWQSNAVCRYLIRYSMPIYLFHQQVIYFMILWLNGKVVPVIHWLLCFFAAVSVSFVLAHLLMQFDLTRRLLGSSPQRTAHRPSRDQQKG